jgi:hypothetical protein
MSKEYLKWINTNIANLMIPEIKPYEKSFINWGLKVSISLWLVESKPLQTKTQKEIE